MRSPRAQESWQIGPRPSRVSTPSAAAKLASDPPRERSATSGMPSSRSARRREPEQPAGAALLQRRSRETTAHPQLDPVAACRGDRRPDAGEQRVSARDVGRAQVDVQLGLARHDLPRRPAAEHADARLRPVARAALDRRDERGEDRDGARALVLVGRDVRRAPVRRHVERADRAPRDDHAPARPARLEPQARVGGEGVLLDPRPARRAAQLLVRDDEHLDRAQPRRPVRQRHAQRMRGHDHAALHVADARPAQPVAVAGHRPALAPHRVRVPEEQQRRPGPELPPRGQLVAGARHLEPPCREQLAEPVGHRVDPGHVVGARVDRREPLDLREHRRELARELPPQVARPYHPAR